MHLSRVLAEVVQGDDTWLQRLEREQVAGAKEAAGMERRCAPGVPQLWGCSSQQSVSLFAALCGACWKAACVRGIQRCRGKLPAAPFNPDRLS